MSTGDDVPLRDLGDRSPLRIFSDDGDHDSPPADANGLWPGMTLLEFYELYIRPVCLVKAAKRTLDQYDQTLALWVRVTGDPPLPQIDEFTCARFLRGVMALPGRDGPLADNTVRKHCVHVQYCLDRAGPYSRRNNPLGKGFLDDPPLLLKPSVTKNDDIENFSLDEIGQWLDVCHLAARPRLRGVDSKDWWQSLVVFDYNVGVRPESLLALRFDWITTDEFGAWIKVPCRSIKGKKHGRKFYLNDHAFAAIERIRTDRELIFAWGKSSGWLQTCRRRLLSQTEIPKHRQFGFKGLRKAFGTELGKISEIASKMAMGHAGGDVTISSYQHKVIMVEAVRKLPQPVWHRDRDGDQRLLF